jgi:hypothetical protein
MTGKGEAVRNFLQLFAVIGFHYLLLNCACLLVKVSKSALRSYSGFTLTHPFAIAAAFSDRARVLCVDAGLGQRRTQLHQLGR